MRVSSISKTKAVAVSAFVAFVLAFALFTQDRTNIWNIDPTVDLPEMANLVTNDIVNLVAPLPDTKPPAKPELNDGIIAMWFLASLAVAARRVMHDASPTAQGYSVPLYWLLANPKTAPPARA
jgi:hypothetical protein